MPGLDSLFLLATLLHSIPELHYLLCRTSKPKDHTTNPPFHPHYPVGWKSTNFSTKLKEKKKNNSSNKFLHKTERKKEK